MTASLDSLRLRALAQQLHPTLLRANESLAIVGSVARGTATRGSDLNLWVLGPRSGTEVKSVRGVTVTVTRQTPEQATTLTNLAQFDVDTLWVLDDRAGAFEQLRTTWKKHRRRVRADVLRAEQRAVQRDVALAGVGSARNRAAWLRLACWRLLVLRVYIDHGWRSSRLETLEAALPAPLAKRLREVLDLPTAAKTAKAVALLPAVEREAKKHAALPGASRVAWLKARVKTSPRDAAFLARQELLTRWLPAVFSTWSIGDVRGVELLGRHAPKTKRAYELLEGRVAKGTVKTLEKHLAAISRTLSE